MFSAIRLLRTRSDHEASPFVTSWLPSVEAFDDHPVVASRSVAAEVAKAMMNGGGSSVDAAVEEVARAAMRPGSGEVYDRLERRLKKSVCKILSAHGDVSYLEPLVDLAIAQGGLDVFTLNYDLTVEAICSNRGMEVDTGIVDWEPGRPLAFRDVEAPKLNLYKLHGSIDWALERKDPIRGANTRFVSTSVIRTADPLDNDAAAIVIGDREKLTANGPTLALLRGFEEALEMAQRLVVVGYSFGDDHINAVVRNWINTDDSRTLTVLDPFWPRQPAGFQEDLVDGLISSPFGSEGLDPRMNVIKQFAKNGLSEALKRPPEPRADRRVGATFTTDKQGTPIIRLTNLGADIEQAVARIEPSIYGSQGEALRGFAVPNSGADTVPWHALGDIARGCSVDVEPRFGDGAGVRRLKFQVEYLTTVGRAIDNIDLGVMEAIQPPS